ncbi:hypothetical protein HK100_000344 [Physocladia obscura]|uniref:Uncharacterized protein n=1 Tax=Physocladia obscura TaxID=109957 RepID=A0AAD5T0B4_9FUNG|nr:hypothetical protein HK100_000344 [Physocladia obscura]
MSMNDNYSETPIPFDEKFDFLVNYMAQRRCHYTASVDLFGSGSKVFETFAKLNFMGAMKPILKKNHQISKKIVYTPELSEYLPLMKKLKKIMDRREKVINMMKIQAELEFNEMERKNILLHQEFESFLKYKPYMGTLISQAATNQENPPEYLIPEIEEYAPLDPLSLVNQEEPIEQKFEVVKGIDEKYVVEFRDNPLLPLLDPRSPNSCEDSTLIVQEETKQIQTVDLIIELNTTKDDTNPDFFEKKFSSDASNQKTEQLSSKVREVTEKSMLPLKIAPDGEIPNSITSKNVKNWKAIHAWNNVTSALVFKKFYSGSNETTIAKHEKGKDFKAKLKLMLEDQARREAVELRKKQEAEGYIIDLPEEKIVKKLNDDDEDSDQERSKMRKTRNFMKKLKPLENLKYPKIVDRVFEFSWFPVDDVFHPKQPEDSEHVLRKAKVEINAEVLLPIAFNCFRSQASSKVRKEILQYMQYLLEEFGVSDTTSIISFYLKYLQNSVFVRRDDDEIEVRAILHSLMY